MRCWVSTDMAAFTPLSSRCATVVGAGTVIDQFERDGRSLLDPSGRHTLRFRYSDAAPWHAEWRLSALRSPATAR